MPTTHIFGYGSLMCPSSRHLTGNLAFPRICRVWGFERSWTCRSSGLTAVSVKPSSSLKKSTIGVLLQISLTEPNSTIKTELANFDDREVMYDRVKVPLSNLEILSNQNLSPPLTDEDDVFVYVSKNFTLPDKNFPIRQSYVDVIIRGCLEEGGEDFARQFVESTSGWESGSYLDDRVNPGYVRAEPAWVAKNKDRVDTALGRSIVRLRTRSFRLLFARLTQIIGSSTSLVVSLAIFVLHIYNSPTSPKFLSFLIAAVLNAGLSKLLKRVANVQRPDGSSLLDPGMPSSHGMSLGFIATSLLLTECSFGVVLGTIFFVYSSLSYRLRMKYHTVGQLVVGLMLGSGNSFFWHKHFPVAKLAKVAYVGGAIKKVYLVAPLIVGAGVVSSLERFMLRKSVRIGKKS